MNVKAVEAERKRERERVRRKGRGTFDNNYYNK